MRGKEVNESLVSVRGQGTETEVSQGCLRAPTTHAAIEKSLISQSKLLIGLPQIGITIILSPILSGPQPSLAARKLG
jgi:hypothetical protein